VDYVRRLGARAGAAAPDWPVLALPCEAAGQVAGTLAKHGIEPHDRLVVVHAGAINGGAKRWPAANWSQFADAVHDRTGAKIVLVGASGDASLADRVVRASRAPVVSLAGTTGIVELAALIERADLVASSDSGPLHLAVALGRPLVAVYGPTDPAIYGPNHPRAPVRVHRADLPCSPCYSLAATAECPLGDPICMRLVSVQSMVESAVALLSGREDQLAVPQQDTLQNAE
jgi:ADP-heptose:LPS heptosyltransferase